LQVAELEKYLLGWSHRHLGSRGTFSSPPKAILTGFHFPAQNETLILENSDLLETGKTAAKWPAKPVPLLLPPLAPPKLDWFPGLSVLHHLVTSAILCHCPNPFPILQQ
jgi:hypothetical protein